MSFTFRWWWWCLSPNQWSWCRKLTIWISLLMMLIFANIEMSETFAQWAAMLLPDPMACLLVLSPFQMEDQVKIHSVPFLLSHLQYFFWFQPFVDKEWFRHRIPPGKCSPLSRTSFIDWIKEEAFLTLNLIAELTIMLIFLCLTISAFTAADIQVASSAMIWLLLGVPFKLEILRCPSPNLSKLSTIVQSLNSCLTSSLNWPVISSSMFLLSAFRENWRGKKQFRHFIVFLLVPANSILISPSIWRGWNFPKVVSTEKNLCHSSLFRKMAPQHS